MDSLFNVVCRACLATKDHFSKFLTDEFCQKLYTFCTSIQVLEEEEVSKALCDECYITLTLFSDFKNKCIESNNKLTSLVEFPKCKVASEFSDGFHTGETEDFLDIKTELDENDQYLLKKDCFGEPEFSKKHIKQKPKRRKTKTEYLKPKKKYTFKCDKCNKKYVNADSYHAHLQSHDGHLELKCETCLKTFRSWVGLSFHRENDHSVVRLESLQCSTCGKVCKTRQTLKIHEKWHKEKQTMICDICGKKCTSKGSLETHLRTHEENRTRPYICMHCNKSFFTKGTLCNHIDRLHTGRRYICNYCNYAFTDKHNLSRHILVHQGRKKKFNCELCEKSFAFSSSLVEHKRIHTGEKPFACAYCPKRFPAAKRLTEHHRIHTGEKPYKCTTCSQAFNQKSSLKRHIKVHQKNLNNETIKSVSNSKENTK